MRSGHKTPDEAQDTDFIDPVEWDRLMAVLDKLSLDLYEEPDDVEPFI
jgi:hypothetical protein